MYSHCFIDSQTQEKEKSDSEHKKVTHLLEEMHKKIEENDEAIKQLKQRNEGLYKILETSECDFKNLHDTLMGELEKRCSNLSEQIDGHGSNSNEMQMKIHELENQLEIVKGLVTEPQRELIASIEELNNQVDIGTVRQEVGDGIKDVSERVTGI